MSTNCVRCNAMNIEAMFPTGRKVGDKILVRKGAYDWPAAEMKDGEWVITDFGRRVAKPVPEPKRPILRVPSKAATGR